jgi:hypothetical protein
MTMTVLDRAPVIGPQRLVGREISRRSRSGDLKIVSCRLGRHRAGACDLAIRAPDPRMRGVRT